MKVDEHNLRKKIYVDRIINCWSNNTKELGKVFRKFSNGSQFNLQVHVLIPIIPTGALPIKFTYTIIHFLKIFYYQLLWKWYWIGNTNILLINQILEYRDTIVSYPYKEERTNSQHFNGVVGNLFLFFKNQIHCHKSTKQNLVHVHLSASISTFSTLIFLLNGMISSTLDL